jgi:hypothetical protein
LVQSYVSYLMCIFILNCIYLHVLNACFWL